MAPLPYKLVSTDRFKEPFKNILDDLIAQCHQIFDLFRKHFNAPFKERQLEVNIIDDDELNARATCNSDRDIILIYRGAIERIYGTMLGLASVPSFLTAVGNVDAETKRNGRFSGGFPPMPLVRSDSDVEEVNVFLPNDRDRSTFAFLLADLALEFLVFHEIGHIVGGHLEILQAINGGNSLAEFDSSSPPPEDIALRRVLECDADAFACHSMFGATLERKLGDNLHEILKIGGLGSYELMFITLIDAVSVLFRLHISQRSLRN